MQVPPQSSLFGCRFDFAVLSLKIIVKSASI